MEVNILNYTTGGVLLMECKNKWQRPVAYLSKFLNITKRNFEIYITKRYQQLLEGWKTRVIYQRVQSLSSRFRQTIRIQNIS